ncbi:hypothetical protein SmJEL517_g02669 [Synchytrium microbalum]|uniref:SEC7 domain-containing protein n=1 Tax=Synchytrium microbalum TaxID=1806994 RepID=A0A507C9I8_9FUNG|nr:uncharacterized protein SmJEL517_g02669 [Synchytrium microbalum]TPX34634.1 hypothetical protein SmJEL517_g02669 [Synchytrium microbalum]
MATVDPSILRLSLERLLAESQRNQKDLRDSLRAALDQLKIETDQNQSKEFSPNIADSYWQPFKLGCQPSCPPKVREIALDGIQKLIAHNLLRGSLPITRISTTAATLDGGLKSAKLFGTDLDAVVSATTESSSSSVPPSPTVSASSPMSPKKATLPSSPSGGHISSSLDQPLYLIDEIIQSVCASFTGPTTDEGIQLQILKVLLTAVTSTACEVHDTSLIKVVQTCFNVHLHSRNTTNQVTAKASLTQMINLIFSRMERYADVLAKNVESGVVGAEIVLHNLAETPVSPPSTNEVPVANGITGAAVVAEPAVTTEGSVMAESDTPASVDHRTSTTAKGDDGDAAVIPPVNGNHQHIEQAPESTTIAPNTETPVSPPPTESHSTPSTRASVVTESMVITTDNSEGTGTHTPKISTSPYNATVASYNELLKRDVYVVLRLLCRLSMHSDEGAPKLQGGLTSNNNHQDEISPLTTKTRILALELIMSVMNNSGPIIQSDELYVSLIRQSLCLSISRNAIATNPMLFELSLSIFLMLVRMYRAKIKLEIEVLLSTVFLHILEMGNSSYKQKSMVLQGLLKISENPQTLVDLYLNYDCDLAMVSIFEKIVAVCSRAAQGRETPAAPAPTGIMSLAASAAGLDSKSDLVKAQEKRLKLRGLCCLVAIMNSLVEWTIDLAPGVPIVLPGGKIRAPAKRAGSPARPRDSTSRSLRESEAVPIASTTTTLAGEPRSMEAAKSSAGSLSTEIATKSLRDALAPTSQSNPVVVYKHPLHSVSMSNMPYNFVNSSTGSLRSDNGTQEDGASLVEEMASRKLLLKQCVTLFNTKPVKGMAAMIENGFVQNEPVAIAMFLRENNTLSKSAMGDYLGEGDAFNIKVMHSFIDSLNFAGQPFVNALRSFLQTFRLPGESQKIDRIMEKFADRYCETNPDIFAKADTAYILAFSTIMLNTDQHSSQIKHRMDKPAFIKSNRGINDNADLPEEFLADIFDEISKNEIVMEEEQADKIARLAQGWGMGELNERQRVEMYRKEISMVTKKTAVGLAVAGEKKNISPFRPAASPDLARTMFGVASWPVMAVFSRLFESVMDEDESEESAGLDSSKEPRVTDLCIQGMACSIRVAGIFRIETERDAFVTSLAKITGLTSPSTVKPKNIRAIKTLIALANSLGEYLETSWVQVLKCVSLLERLQVIVNKSSQLGSSGFNAFGRRSNENKRSGEQKRLADIEESKARTTRLGSKSGGSNSNGSLEALDLIKPSPALEKLSADLQSQTTVVALDRIFTSTVSLSASAIFHFFRALCQVSAEEMGIEPTVVVTPSVSASIAGSPATYTSLSTVAPPAVLSAAAAAAAANAAGTASVKGETPRMYLLSKIVEIAYYNMPRIRYEWTQIWRILQPHFSAAACHQELHVATFAIDSLRQLSMKFLEREELGHYAAQSEFLRSFEWIIKHNSDERIRELILGSMSQMITARAKSIRSGWKSIFVVLAKGAQRDSEGRLAKQAFSIVHLVFREYFDVVTNAGSFVDFVHCLAEFALLDGQGRDHEEMVMGSIQLLQYCAKHLAKWDESDKEQFIKMPKPLESPVDSPPRISSDESTVANMSPKRENGRASSADTAKSVPAALGFVSEEQFFLKWFPILSALSRVVIDSDSSAVRGRALDALFDVLKVAGHRFEGKYWKNVYRSVVLPIFEDLRDPTSLSGRKASLGSQKEGLQAVWIQTLRQLVDLVTVSFEKFTLQSDHAAMLDKFEGLFQGVLDLTVSMLERRDEKLATTGQICFQQLLTNNIARLAKADLWGPMTDALEKAFRVTTPHELLNCEHVSSRKTSVVNNDGNPIPNSPARPAAEDDAPSSPNLGDSRIGANGAASPRMLSNAIGGSTPSLATASMQAIGQSEGSPAQMIHAAAIAEGNRVAKAASGNAPPLRLEKLDFEHTIVKCGTHLELIQGVRDLCLSKMPDTIQSTPADGGLNITSGPPMSASPNVKMSAVITLIPSPFQERWLACVHGSYCLARAFNADYELRHAIWRRGLVQQMPNLVKQETVAISTFIKLMFAVYRARGDIIDPLTGSDDIAEQIASESCDVLERFVSFLSDQPRNARDINLWSPVVVMVLKELLAMESWWTPSSSGSNSQLDGPIRCLALRRHLPRFFRLSIRVMVVDRAEVRQTLLEFLEKVAEVFLPST